MVKIKVMENGPIIIDENNKRIALCRCGNSNNKPYCDGTHNKINFKAKGEEINL